VYVDLAEKGYTVDITNRGRLVAQLVPVTEPGSPLERLIAAGIIEPAEEPGGVGDLEPYPSRGLSRDLPDSSALVKLALTGPESAELARWLAERDGQPLVSSALHRAEVPRVVWQAEPGALPRSYKVIKRIARVALSPDVLDDSATLPPQELSPAHAIHLASALAVKRDLTAFVSYDGPLLAAAQDAGLPVASPGSP
jgi:antitoxin (DNA-binding transcriptional repressor) of toxin-antitoxin stability system/predicted nucleic acid-binding protein